MEKSMVMENAPGWCSSSGTGRRRSSAYNKAILTALAATIYIIYLIVSNHPQDQLPCKSLPSTEPDHPRITIRPRPKMLNCKSAQRPLLSRKRHANHDPRIPRPTRQSRPRTPRLQRRRLCPRTRLHIPVLWQHLATGLGALGARGATLSHDRTASS